MYLTSTYNKIGIGREIAISPLVNSRMEIEGLNKALEKSKIKEGKWDKKLYEDKKEG